MKYVINKHNLFRSENKDGLTLVVHKQSAGSLPKPSVLGSVRIRGQFSPISLLQAASCAGPCRVAENHQALESFVLPVEPYFEATGV